MKKSTRVLSLVLALMMLFSAFSVLASAKEVDVAQTSATVTSDGTARLYFNMSAVSWWTAGTSGSGNFAYFFNNSTGKNAWSAHSVQYSGSTYYVVIPAGSWAGVILTRNNTSTAPSWDNKWNQTGDITMSSTSNYISKFADGSTSVTWGTAVKPASTAAILSADTVELGGTFSLVTTLTSNANINTVKSVTYSATNGTVTDGVYTANTVGEDTVTATVTYYPNGYSSLTSTATATATITVTEPVTPPETPATDDQPDVEEPTDEPTEPPVDKTELFDAIGAAVDYDMSLTEWTEDSWNAMQEALAAARKVYEDENATQDDVDAATKALLDAIDGLEEKPIAKTAYCIDSAKWGTVVAHAWIEGGAGTTWPGQAMTKTGETVNGFNVYEVTFNADYENIIFNNNNAGKQTDNLTFEEGKYYDLKAGVWYDSLADVPAVDPLSTDRYLLGSFNGWNALSHEFKLDEVGSTTGYVSIELAANTTYEFKIIREGAWTSNSATITGDRTGLTFSSSTSANCKIKTTIAGTYVFAFGMNDSKLSVTYPVEPTEEPTEAPTEEPTEAPTEEPTEAPTDAPASPDQPVTEPGTDAPVQYCEPGYYLVGTLNGVDCWSTKTFTADRMLVPNPGAEGEYMLDYTFVEGDAIKVVYTDGYTITKWYNDGGKNYTIGASKAGDCTLYFRPEGNSEWSYEWFTVQPKTVVEPTDPTEAPTDAPASPDQPATEPTDAPVVNPTKVDGVTVTGTTQTTIDVEWEAIEGAQKYWIYANGVVVAASTGTSATINAKPGIAYEIRVTAKLADDTVLLYNDADSVETTTTAVVKPEVTGYATADATSVTLTWDTVDGAAKYWIYKATSENGPFEIYCSTTTNSVVINNLAPNTTYYFKVTTIVNGVISDLDAADVISARTLGPMVYIFDFGTTISIDWDDYENADKYWVIAEVDGTTYTYATTESKLKLPADKFGNAKFTVRARVVVDGETSVVAYN